MLTLLKFERQKRGLPAYSVARKVGLTAGHYSRLENGRRGASPRVAQRLAVLFRRSIEDLLSLV